MDELKEVKLPSGAVMKMNPAPFADSKELWGTLLAEGTGLVMDPEAEIDANLFKNIFCVGFSSKKIESAVWKCMARCTYNGLPFTAETFEPISAREDYLSVLFEVTQENIAPFTKNLTSSLKRLFALIPNGRE